MFPKINLLYMADIPHTDTVNNSYTGFKGPPQLVITRDNF